MLDNSPGRSKVKVRHGHKRKHAPHHCLTEPAAPSHPGVFPEKLCLRDRPSLLLHLPQVLASVAGIEDERLSKQIVTDGVSHRRHRLSRSRNVESELAGPRATESQRG